MTHRLQRSVAIKYKVRGNEDPPCYATIQAEGRAIAACSTPTSALFMTSENIMVSIILV